MSGSRLEKMREEEREARKTISVEAAVRLFGARPYHQVGMREIAAEAGLSPASIYRYFSDRDDLFVEALLRESRAIVEGFQGRAAQDPPAGLRPIAGHFVECLLERGAFFQMMTHFMVDGGISPEAVGRFNAIERGFVDFFEQAFQDLGIRENARLRAHAFFAALNGVLITFWSYPGRRPEETRRHMLRLAGLIAETFEKDAG